MKLSIVVPCYNEEPVLQETTARLSAVLDSLIEKQKISSDSFILYVNDGSRDKTWTLIMSLHEGNPYVKGLNLAGNVGHQNALMAGLMVAKEYADILVSIDADLQDDVSVIEEWWIGIRKDTILFMVSVVRGIRILSLKRIPHWLFIS